VCVSKSVRENVFCVRLFVCVCVFVYVCVCECVYSICLYTAICIKNDGFSVELMSKCQIFRCEAQQSVLKMADFS